MHANGSFNCVMVWQSWSSLLVACGGQFPGCAWSISHQEVETGQKIYVLGIQRDWSTDTPKASLQAERYGVSLPRPSCVMLDAV